VTMPRTKKTTVSRETKSASTARGSAGTKLKSEPPQEPVITLPSGTSVSWTGAIMWHEFDTLVKELSFYFATTMIASDLDIRLKKIEDFLKIGTETKAGYSMEQWIEDYQRWRDRIIGLALDDAIAALKPES